MTKYFLSPDLKWKAFKKIQDANNKANNEQGPYPVHFDKMLWQLLKEKMIYMWLEKNQMIISLKPPRGEVRVIENRV